MMRGRLPLIGLLVTSFVLSGAAAAASTDGQPDSEVGFQQRTPAAEAAFRDVTRCLNSGQNPRLDVLYLVDQSDSIERDGLGEIQRDVLTSSIGQLQQFVSREIDVAYLLAGFSTSAQLLTPEWVDATSSESPAEIVDQALNVLPPQNNLTDWESGFRLAIEQFDRRGSDACRMLIWMTDGALIAGSTEESSLESLANICRPGIRPDGASDFTGPYTGLVHQLRERGVPIFGVFFTNPGLVEGLDGFQQWKISFMQPIVEGSGSVVAPTNPYGRLDLQGYPIDCTEMRDGVAADGLANGAFIRSEDPVALAVEFLRLDAGIAGGSGLEVVDGRFTVPPGTAYFRAIVPSTDWHLIDPTGSAVQPGRVTVAESGGATSIEVDVDEGLWGEWTVESEGSAVVYLFTGLRLTLDRDLGSSILSGVENTLTGQVEPEPGRNVALNDDLVRHFPEWGSATPTIVAGDAVVDQDGSLSSSGVFEISGLVPSSPTEVELRVSMPLGGGFDPIESTFRLEVVDSSAFAFPLDKRVELSALEGPNGTAAGVLSIQPPVAGAGPAEVCVEPGWVRLTDVPRAINETGRLDSTFERTVGSEDGCFEVLPETPLEIAIEVRNPEQLDSRVDGAITITSTTADGIEYSEPIAIGFDSRTQQNPWIVAAAIILLFVLGLGLPLLALWVWNRLATKFGPVDSVTRAVCPIRIQRQGRFAIVDGRRDSAGQKITVAPNDFTYVTAQPSSTIFDAHRGAMHARVPWFPLAASWFEWTAPPGNRIVSVVPGSSKQTTAIAEHRAAEVSPDISRSWAIVIADSALASDDSEIDAELVVFSAMQSDVRQYQRRIDDILSTPGLSDAMDAAAHAARTAPAVGAEMVSPSVPVPVGARAASGVSAGSRAPTPPSGAPMPPGGAPQPPSSASPPSTGQGPSAPPTGPLAPPAPPSAGPLAPPPPPT